MCLALLLELTRELLTRVSEDESLHIPVVFNLFSWSADRISLNEWLIEDMRRKSVMLTVGHLSTEPCASGAQILGER